MYYVRLSKLTTKGINRGKDLSLILDETNRALAKEGVELIAAYVTIGGKYDIISVLKAPSETAMERASKLIQTTGYYTAETYEAQPVPEFLEWVRKKPSFIQHWLKADRNRN